MAHVIWTSGKGNDKLDPSLHKKAYAFMQKLREDDFQRGLNVEEIKGSQDKRVRTGRVDDNFRAVMFKIAGGEDATYVIHGIWPHDKANSIAETVTLEMNPINGVPEIRTVARTVQAPETLETPAPVVPQPVAEQPAAEPAWSFAHDPAGLHDALGVDLELARDAASAESESAFMDVVQSAQVEWQGLALLALATGRGVDEVRQEFHLFEEVPTGGTEDEQLFQGLRREAARSSFRWINSDEELKRVIEAGDFGAWRTFLHPEQRNYVTRDYNGPFRLTGGAGTGKTVVAVHRALRIARENADARVRLTTYTRNLADDLLAQLRRLDEDAPIADTIGAPGICVRGVDQIAWSVLQNGGREAEAAAAEVVGPVGGSFLQAMRSRAWSDAVDESGSALPSELASQTFLAGEYSLVVLPNRIMDRATYLRVRRTGRGVSLDRGKRNAVWDVVERYRDAARAAGTTDYDEKAAIAAHLLNLRAHEHGTTLVDHVVVDESQDLTPARLQLLRALAAPGRNDMFICEDSHQRIYGHKVTLGSMGIRIVGRSRRLILNYRTTEENLRWAMSILAPGDYTDMEGDPEKLGFRSARSGPLPDVSGAESMAAELDRAAELVGCWMSGEDDSGAPAPESIAVLVRDRYRREIVVNGLQERGIQVRAVDSEGTRPGMPLVMTMHRAKGLEFTHVLMFGLKDWTGANTQPEGEAADALLRERSLFYVAATRARDVLAVSWSGDRPQLIPA